MVQMRNRGTRYDLLKLREDRMKARLCPNCGRKVEGRNDRIYCSSKCSHEWWAKTSWGSFRLEILRRDKEGCTECHQPWTVLLAMGRVAEVHHDVPVRLNQALDMEKEFDASNCRAVCNVCHKRLTRRQYRVKSLLYKAGRQQMLLAPISLLGGSKK